MKPASPIPGWPRETGRSVRRRQSGQAAIYGLFLIVSTVVGLFFLFNTGQLVREKTKLVNTSDAVAYSAGVMNARTLNYEAYANRAMLANTVAIAQLVSASSWVRYVETMTGQGMFFTGGQWVNWAKYPEYYPSYVAAQKIANKLGYLNENEVLEKLAKGSDDLIRKALMTAQQTAYAGAIPARAVVMDEVARANYLDDGTVAVDPVSLSATELSGFVARYSGNERTRFAETAQTAANRDGFVRRRSWGPMPAAWPDGCYYYDWLSRRGGTNLIGFDEWKAMDTLSEFRWKTNKYGNCVLSEYAVGYGGRLAADNPAADTDISRYDYSRIVNPFSSLLADAEATTRTWNYSGLPAFFDLSEAALKEANPTLRFTARLRRQISQTLTSEGRSQIRNSGDGNPIAQSLNNFRAAPAGGDELVAVSTAEVYFDRRDDNAYGSSIGKPVEIGSLFNPYWRVHLVSPGAALQAAQAMQGAVLR